MVCGMSSWFFQVTVVPALTVSCAGENVKLSIVTTMSSQRAADIWEAIAAATARRMPRLRSVANVMTDFLLALQRRVDDRKPLIARLEVDAGDADQAAKPVVGDLHWAGRGRSARCGLREGGGARGVEGDVAFDLLHHLMDMAVEHGHRAKAFEILQRAGAVFGTPTPGRIHRP